MADTNELKTTRLVGSEDDGVDIAAKWPNFEAAIRTIFGIPADTAMSEAMQMGTGPNIAMTGSLTLKGDPTTDLMAATKQYVGSVGSGVGLIRCRVYLTSDETDSTFFMPWDAADINEGSVWSAVNPTRLTIPVGGDGDYLVGFSLAKDGTALDFSIQKNRSSSHQASHPTNGPLGFSGMIYFPSLAAGDYLELYCSSSGTYESANCTMWLFNLE